MKPKYFFIGALLIFLLSFSLRWAFSIDSFEHADTYDNYETAVNLAQGKGYTNFSGQAVIGRPPTYILLLAAVYKFSGNHFSFMLWLVQTLLLIALVYAQYVLLKNFTDNQVAYWVTGLLNILYVPHYLFAQQIAPEVLMACLLLLYVVAFLKNWSWWWEALVFAALLLAKGTFIFIPLLLYPLKIVLEKKPKLLLRLLLIYLGCALFISPWVWRNYREFKTIIISSTGTGNVLWPGNNLASNGYWLGKNDPVLSKVHKQYTDVAADKELTRLAVQSMRAHPLATGKLWLKKAVRYWRLPIGYETLLRKNTLVSTAWLSWYWAILLIALYGLLRQRQQFLTLYAAAILSYMWGLHIVLYAIPRYHYPVMPLLFIFSGLGVLAIWERIKTHA